MNGWLIVTLATMPEHSAGGREERVAAFQQWVRDVRDPAQLHSEGLRSVETRNGKATAEYEIAPLSSGRYAIRYALSYHCGNASAHSSPWTVFRSRDECVDHFLESARRHFQPECRSSNCNDIQKAARMQMLELLNGGLFGFVEPEPTDRD